MVRNQRPDIVWFMTDPRFYEWLWFIEHEIRPLVPMVYYHVWDNYPPPTYNRPYYLSNDFVACISKVTHDVVQEVAPEVDSKYVPHAVDTNIFSIYSKEKIDELRKKSFGENDDKVTFFWNNRNARRKQSGSVAWWFNEFANEVGRDKVRLIMHTNPDDQHGQPLHFLIQEMGADDGVILLSTEKVPPSNLADIYNICDCTINIADAEGFGLSTLESLSCGTPILVNMTGGLQEQVTDGEEWYGIGIDPAAKSIIGSQQVPYICEDRVSRDDFVSALHDMYNLSKEKRLELGRKVRGHVLKNYNFDNYCQGWVDLMLDIHEKHGSWDTRKNYTNWQIKEVI